MDILYLLIPLSAVLVLGILGVFAWALNTGQFDDLEARGRDILAPDPEPLTPINPVREPSTNNDPTVIAVTSGEQP